MAFNWSNLDQIGMIFREGDPWQDEAGGGWRCDQLLLPTLLPAAARLLILLPAAARHNEQVRRSALCQQLLPY